jgi:hypothetical protein
MREIKIFHEAPLGLFDKVQGVTDGDYALVHLLEGDLHYAAKFQQIAKEGDRDVILDNSAYELGAAFNAHIFANWVSNLEPDTYVVPDIIGNATHTLDAFSDWVRKYDLPGKKMGVLQGKSMHEATNCFKALKALGADIIGIPFLIGRSWFKDVEAESPTPMDLLRRRVELVHQIWDYCDRCPIHLLGVALPQEGLFYREVNWIESVDTSNPVVHGMFGIPYTPAGLNEKRSELLADLIHTVVPPEQEAMIFGNIQGFKNLWRRAYR